MKSDPEYNRLRWQCRRGMLELDLLLLEFLEASYPGLDASARQAFVALLEYPDDLLQSWLFGETEADLPVRDIVKTIRAGEGRLGRD